MKKRVPLILCLLTWIILSMFFVQERTRVIPVKKLNGYTLDAPWPDFVADDFYYGKFQEAYEKHLRYNFGFREVLIRVYNQYIWDCYHKIINSTIRASKDNWLFGGRELENYYSSYMYNITSDRSVMKAQFDKEASRLYKVQNILEEYGVFVFVTMLPSKEFIYPEHLPEDKGPHKEPFHAFEYYSTVFDSLDVNYIDVMQIFKDWKGKVDFPLYPKTGAHWTYIASAHAFDTIMRYVEDKSGCNLLNYKIGEKEPRETLYPDADLEDLLNLIRPIKPNQNYYAETEIIPDSTAIRPKAIFIGDSYFWNLTKSVKLNAIFSDFSYWYYNSTVHYHPQYHHTSEMDILKEILQVKIIDLTYSPVQLYVFSNGFLPKALLYLTHEDQEIDSVLNVVPKDSLFLEPEKYFPDLATDSIPTTRNSRCKDLTS